MIRLMTDLRTKVRTELPSSSSVEVYELYVFLRPCHPSNHVHLALFTPLLPSPLLSPNVCIVYMHESLHSPHLSYYLSFPLLYFSLSFLSYSPSLPPFSTPSLFLTYFSSFLSYTSLPLSYSFPHPPSFLLISPPSPFLTFFSNSTRPLITGDQHGG